MASGFSLKDQLFNADKVAYLASLFADADAGFDADGFRSDVMAVLPDLELKQRINLIADCLGARFPGALPQIAPVLVKALPPPLDPSKSDDDFGDFIFAPLGELVAARAEDDPGLALDLIEEITQRFSMEWAVRPLLNRWPDLVLRRMSAWTDHDSYHVRRLVSEGTRPRLPWGQGITLDATTPLPLLDALHADGTRYVTRSVANHLNDVSKLDPDLVMDRLDAWAREGVQNPRELEWMTRHALRGRIKAGDTRALKMLGYDSQAVFYCNLHLSATKVAVGDAVQIAIELTSKRETPVLVDYRIDFATPGERKRSKVFKLKQSVIRAGAPLKIAKAHRMKGDATTFQLHPGRHSLTVLVNGNARATAEFNLTTD